MKKLMLPVLLWFVGYSSIHILSTYIKEYKKEKIECTYFHFQTNWAFIACIVKLKCEYLDLSLL